MTLYVRTDYVPEDCDYLTVGKLYEVTDLSHAGDSGNILCDDNEEHFILLEDKCTHIGKEWEQVTLEDEQMTKNYFIATEFWIVGASTSHFHYGIVEADLNKQPLPDIARASIAETGKMLEGCEYVVKVTAFNNID